ncbi:MAG: DNRLRE domain-containing protein [Ardenticatenaceae bacterium]|nr:DNRLRE domain-containing protein [Ardenticatenaceae bacterium]
MSNKFKPHRLIIPFILILISISITHKREVYASVTSDASIASDCYISSRNSNTAQCGQTHFYVGYNTYYLKDRTRAFFKFNLPSMPANSYVQSAKLRLYSYSWQNNNSYVVDAYRITSSWSSPTWNNQPSINGTVRGSATVTKGSSQYFYWTITSLVQDWYNGTSNYGLMLRGRNESEYGNVFYSKENTNYHPIIQITFASLPSTPTLYNINNSGGEGNYTIDWSDTANATSYDLQEQVNGGSWNTIYTGSNSQYSRSGRTTGTWCYHVRGKNSGGNGSWSSTKCTIVLPSPPVAPTLSAISNVDGNGDYTVEWSAVNGATSYTLQEQLNSDGWLTIYTGSSTSRTLSGHADGTWCYRVQASNSGGNSSWSDEQCTTVAATSSDSWTFMLYFAGDTGSIDNGNVHAALVRAIQRLEQNPNPHVNLVVLLDGPATLDTFRITFSSQANYQPLGEKRMDDPATLVQFVQQAQSDFPADHYYLAVADHANGVQGIAWDTTTNSNRTALLTPNEIRQALATITSNGSQPIDIIHFDGCSFGLLENAVIAQDYAQYMVASQNIGWSVFAYDDYRNAVSNNSLPADLAVAIAQRYMERVSQQQYPYTISVLDLNQLSSTLSALDAFSVALTDFALVNQSNRSILANIRNQSQKFDSGGETYLTINDEDSYIDLVDFATRTKLQLTGYNIPTTANNLIEAVTGSEPLVIYESHRSGSFDYFGSAISWNLDGAHGISLYYPKRAAGAMYGDYTSGATFPNFYSQVSWHAYLQASVAPLAPGEQLPDDQPSPLAPLDPLMHHTFLPTVVR